MLSNLLLQCFYTAFNGSVCDEDHWKYFNDCLGCVYVKTKYTRDPMRFLNTFIEFWNENIDTFIMRVGNKYDEKLITVVSNNGLRSVELSQFLYNVSMQYSMDQFVMKIIDSIFKNASINM